MKSLENIIRRVVGKEQARYLPDLPLFPCQPALRRLVNHRHAASAVKNTRVEQRFVTCHPDFVLLT